MTTSKYEVINYFDTYQIEEEDGNFTWAVNNQCSEGIVELEDGDGFRQSILDKLKEANLLIPEATLEDLTFDDLGEMLEIRHSENGQPLFMLVAEA